MGMRYGIRKAKSSTANRNEEVIGIRKAKRSTADRNEDVIGGLGKQRGVKPTEMRIG